MNRRRQPAGLALGGQRHYPQCKYRARRGSLLFAVEFRTGPAWDAAKKPHEQPHFRDHSQNLRRLREAGHLVLGARYADKGLVVLAAASEAAARALVEADPAVQNKVFAYELHPFHVFYGGSVQPPPPLAAR